MADGAVVDQNEQNVLARQLCGGDSVLEKPPLRSICPRSSCSRKKTRKTLKTKDQ